MPDVLVVAATARELNGVDGLVCGIGPVDAAAATARTLAMRRWSAVLHVGIAGARGLEPGTIVLGSESVYCDLAAAIPVAARAAPDVHLLEAARRVLPAAPVSAIGTSAAVGGVGHQVEIEAMEGFGVLRAAALAGVPALEVRAISNEIGELDRSAWRFGEALAALDEVVPVLVTALRAVTL